MKRIFTLIILSVFLTSVINLFGQTVYTNKTDAKYHLLTCKYLDPTHDSLDIAFAIKKGLSPCGVCKPTAQSASSSGSMGGSGSMGSSKGMESQGMNQQGTSSANAASKQCIVINKDGKRCIGKAEPGTDYCLEHRKVKK
jgi:hypothetical protein